MARQIEAGAPAILFILPIRNGWIMRLIKKRWIRLRARHCSAIASSLKHRKPASRKISPSTAKPTWTSPPNGGRLAVGDPEHVPAGIYAKEHCKNWAHGIRSPRNWLRRKMFVARWRLSNQ
ncbi:hypothetical protein ACNKHM_02990 [Shigella sonnei]